MVVLWCIVIIYGIGVITHICSDIIGVVVLVILSLNELQSLFCEILLYFGVWHRERHHTYRVWTYFILLIDEMHSIGSKIRCVCRHRDDAIIDEKMVVEVFLAHLFHAALIEISCHTLAQDGLQGLQLQRIDSLREHLSRGFCDVHHIVCRRTVCSAEIGIRLHFIVHIALSVGNLGDAELVAHCRLTVHTGIEHFLHGLLQVRQRSIGIIVHHSLALVRRTVIQGVLVL